MSTPLRLPPAAPGGWLMGNFREFNRDKLGTVTRYARTHGDVVSIRLGPVKAVLVSDPALIEEVLVTRAKEFTKGFVEQLVRPTAGNGIFLSEGDFWKRQRRMVAPPFHRQKLAGYGEIMVRTAERVTAGWKDGEVRDVFLDTTRIGLAVAAKTLFGVDVEDDSDGLGEALTTVMDAVRERIDAAIPLPDFVPTRAMRRLKRAKVKLDTILYRAIAERRAKPDAGGDDLLSLLLAARDEDDGRGMTDEQLRDEAMTLFVAGFETSAINLAWVVHLLATHPDAADRLRAALDTALAGRTPGADDLPRLAAVEHVVHEALRLYPPAWAMDRMAVADLQLGDFHIRRGVDLWMSPWVTHRDPRFWPDPDRFDPDRWNDAPLKKLPKFAYFPFGGGPRVCIGNAFAMMETQLVTTLLVQRFRFTSVEGHTPKPEPGFTLRPNPGVTVRVERIGSSAGEARAQAS